MKEEQSLLPCPFCGAELVYCKDNNHYHHPQEVNYCFIEMETIDNSKIAVKLWNTRTPIVQQVRNVVKLHLSY
jgi:hypothetical protein